MLIDKRVNLTANLLSLSSVIFSFSDFFSLANGCGLRRTNTLPEPLPYIRLMNCACFHSLWQLAVLAIFTNYYSPSLCLSTESIFCHSPCARGQMRSGQMIADFDPREIVFATVGAHGKLISLLLLLLL